MDSLETYVSAAALIVSVIALWLSHKNRQDQNDASRLTQRLRAQEILNQIDAAYQQAELAYREYWRLARVHGDFDNANYYSVLKDLTLQHSVNSMVRDKLKTDPNVDNEMDKYLEEISELEGNGITLRDTWTGHLRHLDKEIELARDMPEPKKFAHIQKTIKQTHNISSSR